MKAKLTNPIKIHNEMPNNKGFEPTFFKVFRDKPAPMKKSVNVRHWRETATIDEVTFVGILR